MLPLLYLHGMSSLDFGPALEQFLGSGSGLSAATVTRLTTQWQDEAKAFNARDLSGVDYVYVWADGIYLQARLEEDPRLARVMEGGSIVATASLELGIDTRHILAASRMVRARPIP